MPETGSTMRTALIATLLLIGLSGCDVVKQRMGIVDPAEKAAQSDAEGRAVGGACRQSGRAIEDCYSIYNWLPKAPIYDGWKEMDAYMRENQLETIAPQLPPPESPAAAKKRKKAEAAAAKAEASESEGEKKTAESEPEAEKSTKH